MSDHAPDAAPAKGIDHTEVRITNELDPRIAAASGRPRRGDSRNGYDFAGMMDEANWRKTDIHRHTTYCGCIVCGQQFKGPHAVYVHLAKVHAR